MSSSKAASKTKLLATRNKKATRPKIKTNEGKDANPEQRFLAKLMEKYADAEGDSEKGAASFSDIMSEWDMNDRNTKQRKVWTSLIDKQYIEPASTGKNTTFTSSYKLTQAGLDAAAVEGIELLIDTGTLKTNEELHERIKYKCMNKRGADIFNLLLKKGPLTRIELAEQELKISNRGAYTKVTRSNS